MNQRGQKHPAERVLNRMESHPVCLKIGVTAHRDLSHVDQTNIERQVRDFFSSLRNNYPDLPLVVLNPLAPGGDMLVARVAVEMGIPLEVPLPMPLEVYEKDYSSPQLLEEFRGLCSAGTVFDLPLVGEYTLSDIQEHGKARNLQYAHMGTYIAGHSHILLALWDGEESEAVGGTASLVNFQMTGFMTGIAEERRSERLLSDKESDIVYHIACPRKEGVPAATEGRWLSQSTSHPGVNIPERYRTTFAYMQEFLRDSIRHKDSIAASAESLISDPQMEADSNLLVINDVYRRADWLAIYYRKLVLGELALTHGLAIMMGISFILYSEYTNLFFLLPAFLTFFLSALLLNKVANTLHWHRKYLDNRALAEGLRVQFYWSLANIENLQSTAVAYDNLMQKQDLELVWIRHVMRSIGPGPGIESSAIENGLDLAIEHWIGKKNGDTGQLGYYQVSSKNRERKLRKNALYGELTLWVGISIAVLLVFIGSLLNETSMNVLLIFMGVLPLMAGVREAYAFKRADKELTKQYQFMHKTFTLAHRKIESADSEDTKKRVLRALGEACLEEHSEWILIHRERPLEHSGLQV